MGQARRAGTGRPASPPKKGQAGLKFLACQPVVTRPA